MGSRARVAAPVPPRIGRYEILLPIASGGMATVYLAQSRGARGFERHVAVKLTHAHLNEESAFAAVLLAEGNLASRIRHRNVVSILDVGEDPLGLFLVMDYVEGDTLSSLQRRAGGEEALPVGVGIRILLDALAGLHAAHELHDENGAPLNVVHRDFSPQNILVGVDGIAQLTDFGIAKAANSDVNTATGVVKGKVSYMAPEQARGVAIDRRVDVWAAGVVAWEILAGRRLYTEQDGIATLLKVVSERPPLLRTVAPEIPAALEQTVAAALEPDISKRTPTAAALASELARHSALLVRVAEPPEVAAFVQRKSGQKLAKRREQAQSAAQLRAKMDALASASIAATSQMTSENLQHALLTVDERVRVVEDDTAATTSPYAGPGPMKEDARTPVLVDAPRPPTSSRRRLFVIAALATLAGVLLVGVPFAVRGGSSAARSAPVATTSTLADRSVPAPSAPALVVPSAPPAPPPPYSASASAPVGSVTSPARAPGPHRVLPPPPPPKNDCDPPYTLGADGVRIPKRHCL